MATKTPATTTSKTETSPAKFAFILTDKAIIAKAKVLSGKGETMAQEWHKVLCSCLNHIAVHNDMRVLDQAFRLIPGSMFRRGVSIWISDHANLRYVESEDRFRKAKKSEAWNIKMAEAIATPFWKYARVMKANAAELDIAVSFAGFVKRVKRALLDGHVKDAKLAKTQLAKIETFATHELSIPADKLKLPEPTKKEQMAETVAKLVKSGKAAASNVKAAASGVKQQLQDSLTETQTAPATSH